MDSALGRTSTSLLSRLLLCWLTATAVCLRPNGSSPGFADGSMRNVTSIRGDTVEFVCRVENGARHTWVAFFRDGVPPRLIAYRDSVFRRTEKYQLLAGPGGDQQQWTLRVKDVQEEDAGGYTCQLNSSPVQAKTGFLELKIPPSISRTATPAAVEVREGHNVTLTCNARGNPRPTIVWRRADRQLIRYDGADGYGDSVHRGHELALSKVSREHMSEYVCVASNGIPPDESWTIKLHVLFEPIVVPQSVVVEARSDAPMARLVCSVEAWPRPTMVWLFEGQPLHDSTKFATSQSVADRYKSVHVLEVREPGAEQFGRYRCVANNDYGSHFGEIQLIETIVSGRRPGPKGPPGEGSGQFPDDEDWSWPPDPFSHSSSPPSVWLRSQLTSEKELRRSVSGQFKSSASSADEAIGLPLPDLLCLLLAALPPVLPLLLPAPL